jgi:hypothetical protein
MMQKSLVLYPSYLADLGANDPLSRDVVKREHRHRYCTATLRTSGSASSETSLLFRAIALSKLFELIRLWVVK